jgi:uncharacterized protein
MDLSALPLVDNHCHSLLREQPRTPREWRRLFTESYYPEMTDRHVEHTVFYQWALRALAGFYRCEPQAEAILEARGKVDLGTLARRLNEDASIAAWLVDFGYAASDTYGPSELAAVAGVRVEHVLRLEPLVESLLVEAPDFDALHDGYVAALLDLRERGYVALKSIIAYRTGLGIEESSRDDARRAFPALRERALEDGKVRIDSKPMLDYLIPLAVQIAAHQEFPVQIHTGFGDPDQDIAGSNPAHLRSLFADQYRGATLVLLHGSYPYVRTLAYLASAYSNVYADFGLALPFVTGDARAVVRELLGFAPASKILYSSDGFHVPELHWLAARIARRALGDVLDEYVRDDLLTPEVAVAMAHRILHGNAEEVYRLSAPGR